MRYRRQIMKRFFAIFAAVVILAGCGGPSLPPLKDYTMNEISFKATKPGNSRNRRKAR